MLDRLFTRRRAPLAPLDRPREGKPLLAILIVWTWSSGRTAAPRPFDASSASRTIPDFPEGWPAASPLGWGDGYGY